MSKKLVPQNGYIIVEPMEEGETLAGNIILPDLGKERPAMGKVLSSSPFYNQWADKWVGEELKDGDIVLIPRVGSQRITVDDKEYYVCKSTEVIAIIEEN
jgi:chaperonin GroES